MEPQIIIARRIAQELKPCMLIDFGISIPTLVANYLLDDIEVFFQLENGLVGTAAIPAEGMAHPMLTEACSRWLQQCELPVGVSARGGPFDELGIARTLRQVFRCRYRWAEAMIRRRFA